MRLRNRLFLLVAMTVAVAVTLVTWFVTLRAREAFEALDAQRTRVLVAQLRSEFDREGQEAVRRVERAAASDPVQRLALDLASTAVELAASYVGEAGTVASAHGLDFLDLVSDDGTIVSSAHWPARFGYPHAGLSQATAAPPDEAPFLQVEEGPDGRSLALLAVRRVRAGDRALTLIGGRRLDHTFLAAFDVPPGMRVLLYRNLEPTFVSQDLLQARSAQDGAAGGPADARRLEPLIVRTVGAGREGVETMATAEGGESVHAIPLKGRSGAVLAVLLVGTSHRELATLVGTIRQTGLAVGGLGILLGLLFSYLLASRVTRPVERLAEGARAVAGGDWTVCVEEAGPDEMARLGKAFNAMTTQLVEQRERLLQAERVAAWRELARRLAHELKNPLFPLRITVENLQRARRLPPDEFTEVFDESTTTLAAGLNSLTGIVARFGDFARMPKPEFQEVQLNDVARASIKLLEAQLSSPGRPAIRLEVALDEGLASLRADAEQIARALQNLLLNAIDAMPEGGRLSVRTGQDDGQATLAVSDTGQGLTEEERTRLFTPYYTTKQHGTGLGLAIVQSIVSDHAGRISVESAPGRGTTFTIRLPLGATGSAQ